MCKYKKCPICELNYIPEDQDMCDICRPENQGHLISDSYQRADEKRIERLEAYNKRHIEMAEFTAIRYNQPQKR